METVVFSLIEEVRLHYPQALQARFSLTDLSTSRENIIGTIGRKRGCLKKGNELDWEKTYKVILKEFREGKWGLISLDHIDRG